MIIFLLCLFLSVILSFGMSVAIVIKGQQWPIRRYNIKIRRFLNRHIHTKAHRVLKCSVCCCFWMTFFSDIVVCVVSIILTGNLYFFWPFSGFITIGLTYTIMEYLTNSGNIKMAIDNTDDNADENNEK